MRGAVRRGDLVLAQSADETGRDLKDATGALGLERHALALPVELVRELDRLILEVDVLPGEPKRLGESASGLGCRVEDQAILWVHGIKQLVQLVRVHDALWLLIVVARALDTIEQGDGILCCQAKMPSCIREYRREYGHVPLDRPALQVLGLLAADVLRHVGGRY